jgi:hypothetical protein
LAAPLTKRELNPDVEEGGAQNVVLAPPWDDLDGEVEPAADI